MLASGERCAQHLDKKASRAEALAKAFRSNGAEQMTDPRPARPDLSASVNVLPELTSSEQYRVAHQKRQAGELLSEEEERVLASKKKLVRHIDEKASRAEALAKAIRSDGWVLAGALVVLGLLVGGMVGGSLERVATSIQHVGSIERAAESLGSSIERAAQNFGNVERVAKSIKIHHSVGLRR